ncbi:MAG: transposase [Lamprobacter sp.]|uniref:IS66-like element accessory protein TnpA n=1 Tax=Lamprobacter sp. TaxID=3100796 RepID=UPI002B26354A|nr:transposase [Lamprobacter sp.]MEA3643498.1 transposase [Lamprobacter sp.]
MTTPTIPTENAKPRRRRFSPDFKATIVNACQQPGASIAQVAQSHNLNANLVHKWIKKAQSTATPIPINSGFIPLPTPPSTQTITITLPTEKGQVQIQWPAQQAMQSAQWLKAVLS